MNRNSSMIIYLVIASIAGVIGKEVVNEYSFQQNKQNAVNKCVSEYGLKLDDCKKMVNSVEDEIRQVENQTGKQKEETYQEVEEKAFIVGCTTQGQTEEYCQCGWDKVIEKYTYKGYENIKSKVSNLGIDNIDKDPELREFVTFSSEELPNLCKK